MDRLFESAFPFLKALNEPELEQLKNGIRIVAYPKGRHLYYDSGKCDGLQLIKKGRMRIFLNSPNGGEITLYRLREGEICVLSAACMMRNLHFDIHMEAEKDTEVYIISSVLLKPLSDTVPAVKDFLLEMVSDRFSQVMWLMNQLVFSNMGQRLAQALLQRSLIAQSDTLLITHDTIARDLGTAREVITRLLKQFQEDDLVVLSRGKIKILDIQGLKAI